MAITNAEYQHNDKWCTAAQLLERYDIGTMQQALDLLSRFAVDFPAAVTGSKHMLSQLTNPMRIRREYLPKFKDMYVLRDFNAEYQHNDKWCTAAQLLERYDIGTMHQALDLLSRFAVDFPAAVTGSNDMMLQLTNPMRIKRECLPKFKEMYALSGFADMQKDQWCTAAQLLERYNIGTMHQALDLLSRFAVEVPWAVTGSDDVNQQDTNPMRIRREYLPRFKKMYALREYADLQKISLLDLQSQFPDATLQEIESSLFQFYSDADKKWVYKYQLPELGLLIKPKIELRVAEEQKQRMRAEKKRLALEHEQNILARKRAALERMTNKANERQRCKQDWTQNRIVTIPVLLRDYVFDADADEDALRSRIHRFGMRFPGAVKYGLQGMYGLKLDYMDKFLEFTRWKLLKAPGGELIQPAMEPGLPGYKIDKTLEPMSDDKINDYILRCMDLGLDGLHKDAADAVLSVTSSKSLVEQQPCKTHDWLSCKELHDIFIVNRTVIAKWLQKLCPEMPFVIKSMRLENGVMALCLHRNALETFAKKSGLKYRDKFPEKGDDWLSVTDLASVFNGHNTIIRENLKELQRKNPCAVQDVRSDKGIVWAMHISALDAFIEEVLKKHWQRPVEQATKQHFLQMADLIKANYKLKNIRAQTQAKLRTTGHQID